MAAQPHSIMPDPEEYANLDAQQARLAQLQAVQAELVAARFTGSAADGDVTAEVGGDGRVVRVTLDPSFEARDCRRVQTLVLQAVAEARSRAGEAARSRLAPLVGDHETLVERAAAAVSWLRGMPGRETDAS